MVATAAAPYGVLFVASCGFGTYLVDRVSADGVGTLGRGTLLPATVMLVVLAVGAVAGAVSVIRQVSATRRLSAHVTGTRMAPPPGTPAGVEVIDHDEPFAFTFGLGEPRVAVSRGLVESLSSDELEAVVVHERYHVSARDPLKLVIARAATRTCFFLPAVSHLVTRYLAGRELAADRHSLRDLGRPALAGALFKVVAGPGWGELETAAAMAGPELLAMRIDQLERTAEPDLPALPRTAVVVSAVVLAALGAVVTAVALQGGLSMMASPRGEALSAGEIAGAVGVGLVCTAAWVWLSIITFRRLDRHTLTTTDV